MDAETRPHLTIRGCGCTLPAVQLTLENSWDGKTALLKCSGRLIFGDEADEFRARVLTLLKETTHIVLNFSGIVQLDSAGIGALIGTLISAKNRHSIISLVALPPKVHHVLEMSHLLKLFPVYENEQQAVAAGGHRS